ncbi:MAG TPA: hypothetical protein PK251_13575 [Candidatus Latescibacteria bacterium]|mgnify:CR=1 FL=1|jgi:MFS family permease|nr:hypothetical protein [Candidatus Latescibacterota bacterium]HOS65770.1 hypothetical protein [Candidatus Latescibacterota bacterium]HPK74692.1 hypothetical protein [Candidatus Latescibacterota bacterium]HQE61505.1 hypothetical protein [Candidatus Latescibacterota bacterium]HQI75913.1 hypothetical protein [Candidatus Latescibacterota bacterium]
MDRTKRLVIATVMGFVCGFVCLGLAASGPGDVSIPVALTLITGRALIGVAIGISCFALGHWAIHGLVMGLVFSLPTGFGSMLGPEVQGFTPWSMFMWTVILGGIYGVVIELVTTVVFKAKMRE